jgi:hypothetical protein
MLICYKVLIIKIIKDYFNFYTCHLERFDIVKEYLETDLEMNIINADYNEITHTLYEFLPQNVKHSDETHRWFYINAIKQ